MVEVADIRRRVVCRDGASLGLRVEVLIERLRLGLKPAEPAGQFDQRIGRRKRPRSRGVELGIRPPKRIAHAFEQFSLSLPLRFDRSNRRSDTVDFSRRISRRLAGVAERQKQVVQLVARVNDAVRAAVHHARGLVQRIVEEVDAVVRHVQRQGGPLGRRNDVVEEERQPRRRLGSTAHRFGQFQRTQHHLLRRRAHHRAGLREERHERADGFRRPVERGPDALHLFFGEIGRARQHLFHRESDESDRVEDHLPDARVQLRQRLAVRPAGEVNDAVLQVLGTHAVVDIVDGSGKDVRHALVEPGGDVDAERGQLVADIDPYIVQRCGSLRHLLHHDADALAHVTEQAAGAAEQPLHDGQPADDQRGLWDDAAQRAGYASETARRARSARERAACVWLSGTPPDTGRSTAAEQPAEH